MTFEFRFKPDPATIVHEYEKFFGDGLHPLTKSGRSRAKILEKLQALQNPTAEEIEAVVGTDVWTQVKCDVCRKPQEAVLVVEATNGEAEVELCAECLRVATAALRSAIDGRKKA